MTVTIMIGDVREQLRKLPENSVHCIVTSPPYWGLRDYGVEGQIGLEKTPAEFIAVMVDVFEELRRVLRKDGTCWVNMGDSYCSTDKWGGGGNVGKQTVAPDGSVPSWQVRKKREKVEGLKPKDLVMMPHRLAIALQDAGWWVRQDIVWSKPNPMPESVRDRCTKSHEYIFLLTKSEKYFYDYEAIKEPTVTDGEIQRGVGFGHGTDAEHRQRGRVRTAGNVNAPKGQLAYEQGDSKHRTKAGLLKYAEATREEGGAPLTRNKRSVWTMATHSFAEAHFATFPPELPENCIKAGCPPGGLVLDPFFGAGTTGLVADRLQRDCIGIELNTEYAEIARARIQRESPLLADVPVVNHPPAAVAAAG